MFKKFFQSNPFLFLIFRFYCIKFIALLSYFHHWQFWILYFIALYNHDDFHIFFCKIKKFIKQRTAQIIRPILRGKDIKRYSYEWADKWLIGTFPTLKLNIDEYQSLKNYLQSFMPKIAQSGEKGCRKKTSNRWFETQDNIAYWNEFARQKIVYSEIVREPQFYLDNGDFKFGNFFAEATSFILTGEKINYLLGILNSKITGAIFKNFYAGGGLGESGYRYKKAFIEKLPIPKVDEEKEASFVSVVDEIIKCKKENKPTKDLEEKLDLMVFELYNLNETEIKSVLSLSLSLSLNSSITH